MAANPRVAVIITTRCGLPQPHQDEGNGYLNSVKDDALGGGSRRVGDLEQLLLRQLALSQSQLAGSCLRCGANRSGALRYHVVISIIATRRRQEVWRWVRPQPGGELIAELEERLRALRQILPDGEPEVAKLKLELREARRATLTEDWHDAKIMAGAALDKGQARLELARERFELQRLTNEELRVSLRRVTQ